MSKALEQRKTDYFKIEMVKSYHSFFRFGDAKPFSEVSRSSIFNSPLGPDPSIHIVKDNLKIKWGENVHYELCVGSEFDRFKQIHENTSYNTGAYYLTSFNDAIADLKSGFVAYEDGRKAWADSCFATIQHGPIHYSPAVEARGSERWFSPSAANAKQLEIASPVMVFTHWGSLVNYGHWLANSLLAAFLALPELKAGKVSLLSPPLSDRQKRELSMIGIPSQRIIEANVQYVKVPHLIYPSPVSTLSNMAPAPICLDMFRALKASAARQFGQPAPEYLYASRLGVGARTMRNEAELIEALATLGVVAIFPHEMSFDAQVMAFSKARVIIGPLGAALWSMPFAPIGGSFVEISTTNYASSEYASLASLMKRRIVQIMVDPNKEGYENDVVFNFDVPVADIVSIVRKLIVDDLTCH